MNTRLINTSLALAFGAVAIVGCKKKIDSPPVNTIPQGDVFSVTDLRNMYQGTSIKFEEDNKNVFAVVTADETSGNLYKNVYITDGPSGLNVRLVTSGGLYIGDSIRINLNNTILSEYNGVLQLDSVDVDENVVKLATNVTVTPIDATIDDVIANPALQSQLVRLTDVEFLNTDVGTTFADATNQISQNKTLVACGGSQVLVRTSGYANFAGATIPSGNGEVVAIVGQFNADKQLLLRNTTDINLPNASCQPAVFLLKDFEDQNVTSGGWSQQMVSGSIGWTSNTQGAVFGSAYGQISNFSGGNTACETWLISPAVDLTGATAPTFSFENAYNYAGPALSVWVSTDYDGSSAPSTATWTQLTVTLSPGGWAWVNSGNIDMTPYISANTYIGFRYTGSNSDGSTWEIDNVTIQE